MKAAYGLSITITMLMTTILLHAYLIQIGQPKLVAHTLTLFFALIEGFSSFQVLPSSFTVVMLPLLFRRSFYSSW